MKTAAAAVLVVFAMAPPHYPQCEQQVFQRANPGLCYSGPFGSFPGGGGGGGGGNGGGLLGTIGRVLGGLTGGLL